MKIDVYQSWREIFYRVSDVFWKKDSPAETCNDFYKSSNFWLIIDLNAKCRLSKLH